MLRLAEIALFLPQLPSALQGLRIIHFSDLHTRGFGPHERALRSILQQGCDLLLCTGDNCWELQIPNLFYKTTDDRKSRRNGLGWRGLSWPPDSQTALDVLDQLLRDIHCPLGIYAVQGNHDPDDFMRQFAQLPVTILNNETRQIDLPHGGRFNLAGVRCGQRGTADIPQTLLHLDPHLFSLAACHYPELAEALAAAGVDLILSGHTHGGQFCLPNQHAFVTHSRTGRRYFRGLDRSHHALIYTTTGVGFSILPLRLFCPPEVVRFTLHHGNSDQTTIHRHSLPEP